MAGKKNLIGYVLLILVIIVFTFGYYLWSKPAVDVAGTDGLKTDAAALYNTFATDSLLAKKKYSQQIIQVTGKVNGISTNQQNQMVILLQLYGREYDTKLLIPCLEGANVIKLIKAHQIKMVEFSLHKMVF